MRMLHRRDVARWGLRLSLAALVGLALGSEVAFTKDVALPQEGNAAFKGIYRQKNVNGQAETVTLTNGKAHLELTEQEYRERGYAPEWEHLPTKFVQRLPVRIHVPAKDLD